MGFFVFFVQNIFGLFSLLLKVLVANEVVNFGVAQFFFFDPVFVKLICSNFISLLELVQNSPESSYKIYLSLLFKKM